MSVTAHDPGPCFPGGKTDQPLQSEGIKNKLSAGKPELLAPAGNPEKLRAALRYGADAVYLAGDRFGLRAGAGNFTLEAMSEGIAYAHALGKKVYLAVNLLAHARDVADLPNYLEQALAFAPDACIVADPGIVAMIRANWPHMPIHLSTQANTTNHLSATFWHGIGVKRIVLARELSLAEMGQMRADTPAALELEAFVHGAMCMAYSGRCFMSLTMTGRDANRGRLRAALPLVIPDFRGQTGEGRLSCRTGCARHIPVQFQGSVPYPSHPRTHGGRYRQFQD